MSRSFVGRNKEIENIRTALKKGESRYISIYGTGGIGKTRLLHEISRLATSWGYDAISLIDFVETRNRDIPGLLSYLIAKLGSQSFNLTNSVLAEFNSTDGEKRLILGRQLIDQFLSEYQTLASSRKVLILFDTFEIVQATDIGQELVPLICRSTSLGSSIIIGGQKPIVFHDRYSKDLKGRLIELQGFSLADTEELARNRLGQANLAFDQKAISKLFYLANRHPLVIDLALSAMLETGVDESLFGIGADEFERQSVVWIKDLPEIMLQVILQTVVLDRRCDLELIAFLNHLPEDKCRQLYGELSNYPFIKADESSKILSIHDDMRFKISKYLDLPQWLYEDLYRRTIQYYKEYYEPRLKDRELVYAKLERIHYQFLLDLDAHFSEWIDLFNDLMNKYDLELCHELLAEIKKHSQRLTESQKNDIELMEGELNLAEYDPLAARSKFEYLISVLDVTQHSHIIARALKGLVECATNNCTIDSSNLAENLKKWENEIEISPLLVQDKEVLGSLLENIGETCQLLGMHSKANEYYSQAKLIYENSHLQKKVADILEKNGVLYREQYRSVDALHMFEGSLRIREELQDAWGIGRLYTKMALVNGDLKRANDAERLYLKSIDYLEQVNDPASLAAAYGGFAWFKFITRDLAHDNLQKAEQYAYKAISIAEDKGFGRGLSRDYHTLFHVIELQKGIQDAEPFIRKACDYARSFADPFMFFDTLVHVAKIDYQKGDYSNLSKYLDEIEDYEKRGTRFSVFKGRLLVILGHVAARESRLQEAVNYYQSGWSIIAHNRTASTVPPLPKEFHEFIDHLYALPITTDERAQIGQALENTLAQQKDSIEFWDQIQSLIQSLMGQLGK